MGDQIDYDDEDEEWEHRNGFRASDLTQALACGKGMTGEELLGG